MYLDHSFHLILYKDLNFALDQEYWQDYILFHSNLLFFNNNSRIYFKLPNKLLSQSYVVKKLYLLSLYLLIFLNDQIYNWICKVLNEYRLELFLKQSKYIHKMNLVYCQLAESIVIRFHSLSNIIFFDHQKVFLFKN